MTVHNSLVGVAGSDTMTWPVKIQFIHSIQFNSIFRSTDQKPAQTPSSSSLTRCSRLLQEIEKQRIENTLNQNNELKSTNVSMETDEPVLELSDKRVEGDSGIENMETEELPGTPSKREPVKAIEVELDVEDKAREIEISLSRILDAFWVDHCEGQIMVPDTVNCHKELINQENILDYGDLVFQIVFEIVNQYLDGKRIDYKTSTGWDQPSISSTPTHSRSKTEITSSLDRMDTQDSSCPTPTMVPHNPADQAACSYLIQCYNRSCNEQDRYNSSRNLKRFGNDVLNTIYLVKDNLVRVVILILKGSLFDTPKSFKFVLRDMLYEEAIPSHFFQHLTEEAYRHSSDFQHVFGTLLNNLFTDMQSRLINKKIDLTPIRILSQLMNISVAGPQDSVVRPFCNLVAKLYNFYPTLCTETPGREIARTSFLGPFLSVSVFAEENPKLIDDADEDLKDNLGIAMQSQLEHMRCELHAISHNLLKNVESRNGLLMFFSNILKSNKKRTQFHSDEKKLARDGFMLNVMTILQKLSVKIKLERVDARYPFHFESLVSIEDDTKLRYDDTEFKDWLATDRKFPSRCCNPAIV